MVDLPVLYKEKSLLNHQFPTVTALSDPPMAYEGTIRCEKGEVKELAKKRVWPFTEYVSWHRFRLTLPEEYPVKPPTATWLTNISHPNIVPNVPGAVCVSVLGDGWRPTLRMISVVNSLYYLLSDPNPNNVFDHPKCLEAARACRIHGFPKHRRTQKSSPSEDIVRFNIIPVPGTTPRKDIVRFRIVGQAR